MDEIIYERNGKKFTRQQLEEKYGSKIDEAISNLGFTEVEHVKPVKEYEFQGKKFKREQLEDKYGDKVDEVIAKHGIKEIKPEREKNDTAGDPQIKEVIKTEGEEPSKKKENAELSSQDLALASNGNGEIAPGSSESEIPDSPIVIPEEGEEEEVGFFEDLANETLSGITRTLAGAYGIKNLLNKQEAALFLSVMPDKYSEALNRMSPKQREKFINNAVNQTSPIGKKMGQFSYEAQDVLTEKTAEIAKKTVQFEGNIVDDIANGNYAQAGRRTIKGVANSASSIALAVAPGGLAVIGAGTASQKQEELESEGEDVNVRSVLNATINGAAEGFMERYTGQIGKSVLRSFRGKKEAAKEFSTSIVKTILKDIGIESASEGATSVIQDLSDMLVQGRDISFTQIMKNAADGAIIGGAMGGGMSAPKALNGYVASKSISKEKKEFIDNKTAEAIEIEEQADLPDVSEELKTVLLKKASAIREEVDAVTKKEVERAEKLSNDQVKTIFELDQQILNIAEETRLISENNDISEGLKKSLTQGNIDQYEILRKHKEEIAKTEFERLPDKEKKEFLDKAKKLSPNRTMNGQIGRDYLENYAEELYQDSKRNPEEEAVVAEEVLDQPEQENAVNTKPETISKKDAAPQPKPEDLPKNKTAQDVVSEIAQATNKEGFLNSTHELPLEGLDPKFPEDVKSRITATKSRNPNEPVTVGFRDGKLRILDGAHRYYEAVERGDKTINAGFAYNEGAEQFWEGSKKQGQTETNSTPVQETPSNINEQTIKASKEVKISDKSPIYTISRTENGTVEIKDPKGKTPSAPTRRKVLEKYSEDVDFTAGKIAPDITEPDTNPSMHIAEQSYNPAEVASHLVNADMDAMVENSVDYKERVISEGIGHVSSKSFNNFGDRNLRTQSIGKSYLRKDGRQIDDLAQELSEDAGVEITPQDIVDFIVSNPNGPEDVARKVKNEKIVPLQERFTQLTGLPANDKYLAKAVEQARQKEIRKEYMTSLDNMTDEELLNLAEEINEFEAQTYGKETDTSTTISPETENRQEDGTGPGVREESSEERNSEEEVDSKTINKDKDSRINPAGPEVEIEQDSTKRTPSKSKPSTFSLNGQTTFYHASEKKRQGRLRKGTAENFGEGVYFSTDKNLVLGQFGAEITEVKLAIENPLYTDSREINEVYDEALRRSDKEWIETQKSNGRWTDQNQYDLEDNGWVRFEAGDYGELAEINAKHISDAAQEMGYDAIIDKESMDYTDEVVVLDESKIIYPEDEAIEQATTHSRSNPLVTERIKPVKRAVKTSPKKLNEIIAKVSKDLKSTLIYGRSGRARSLGTYSPSNTLIRIRRAGDLDTVAHELGHFLDDRFDVVGSIPSEMELAAIRQLKWFSDRGGSNPPAKLSAEQKRNYLEREGLAEFVRAYVANPEQTRIIAPELYEHFENSVGEKTIKSLQEFSDSYIDFANATNGERIASNVESSNLDDKADFKEWLDKFKGEDGQLKITPFDKINAHLLDSMGIANKAFSFLTEISGKENLNPSENFKMMSRIFAGFNGKVHRALTTGLVDAKNKQIADSKGEAMNVKWLLEPLENTSEKTVHQEMDEVIQLLVAERTMEYAKKFQRLDDLTGIGGGVDQDIEVAQGFLNEFKELKQTNKEKYNRIKEASRRYREFADAGLKYAVGKGRISKADYQTIKNNNEYYAALTRIQENAPTEEALDFINEMGGNISSAKEIIKKAKGGTAFIQNPYVSLLQNTVAIMKESDRNEVMQSFVEPLTEIRQMGDGTPIDFSQIGRPAQAGDKNTRTVYVNGQKQNWQFAPDIYKALASLDGASKNPIVDFMALPASLIRFTVTRFPTFALRNAVRDTSSRLVVSRTNSGFKDLIHKADDKALYEMYGGSQAGFYLVNKKSYRETLRKTVNEITNKGGIVLDPRRLGTKYFELLESGENLNRIAEFNSALRKAKKEGLNDYDAGLYAAYQARDLMDFAVAGHTVRVLNKMIPFLNAGVQGLKRTAKAAKEDPSGFAIRTAIYTVLPQVAIRALNHMQGDDEEYEQLPAYQRDLFWNFKSPGFDGWITIPKPFEQGIPSSAVDRLWSKAMGNDKAFEGFGGSVANMAMPYDESSMMLGFKPLVEASVNYNTFTERPIVPEWEEGKLLELRKGKDKASRAGKGVSFAFQKAGMSIDPRKVDHVIQGYGTYMANWGLSLSDLGVEDSRFKFNISKTGFARDVPMSNSVSVSKVYELATELGKWNDRRLSSLRNDIEKFYDSDDKQERKDLTKQIYKKAEKLRHKFEAEKKKVSSPKKETTPTSDRIIY